MTQHHVTYIRDSDRTRVVFVLNGTHTHASALATAQAQAPVGFRWAAYREHPGGRIVIPADGDDYGNETPYPSPNATP